MRKRSGVIRGILLIGWLAASASAVYGVEDNSAPPSERAEVKPSDEASKQPPDSNEKPSFLKRLGITINIFSEFENNTFQPDQEYQKYKNVIDIVGHQGRWDFGAQLRSFVFSDEQRVLPDDFEKPAKFTVYRRYLEYTGTGLQFRAGDLNQSLGNGIVLFLQQDQTLGLDHTIDGGRFGFRRGRLEALFLGGAMDQVTDDRGGISPGLLAEDRQDKLLAARVVGHLPLSATVGLNLVQFFYEGREARRQQVGSVDFKVSGLLNRLDVAGEFAATRRTLDNPFSLQAEHGHAIYLAVTGYALGATAFVEYKNYRDMDSPYSNPPNLGRVDDIITNSNVRGFRLRLDRTFMRTGTTAFISYTQQNSVTSQAPFSFPLPNFTTLLFGGLEQSLQDDRWFIQATIGRRYEKDVGLTQTRAYVDVNRRFWNRHSLGVNYDGRYTDLFLVREEDERVGVSYGLSPYLVFSFLMARQRNFFKETNEIIDQENFFGPELVFTPTSAWFVKIFVGRLPGGLVCSGGLCRQENPFRGLRGTVSYRF
jgi:hypothetical protein